MQSIDFQGIKFVADKALSPIPIEVLASVESRLGFTFPDDYREFITTIGAGYYIDFHLQIWPPQMIVDDFLPEAQDRLAEFWFWDDSPEILTQAQAVECVPLFGSDDGDDILFHPSDRSRWFILQHDVEDETVIVVHSFQELCRFYLQRYEELKAPYRFSPDELEAD
jgi:SMI1-KNR4 cell-wall